MYILLASFKLKHINLFLSKFLELFLFCFWIFNLTYFYEIFDQFSFNQTSSRIMKSRDSMITLMQKLKAGNYPFTRVKEGDEEIYKIVYSYRRFWIFFAISFVTFIFWILFAILVDYKSKISTFAFIVFVIFAVFTYQYRFKRCLEISRNGWSFSIGSTFIVKNSPLYNIYLRVQKMKGFKAEMYYLVIGGIGIDPIIISSSTYNLDLIRVLGRYIAKLYEINFFDVDDVSQFHEIFHERSRKNE
ncbi:hypothetical protein TRFO_26237 [Tritrichomonas foetus]|uniref:Uncharacterized protein n=1 Tax=Tritrichomonas foetus TaxID=1144522 RepID=A0A1J4K364_9EUKA|nr:hypothetical protein TRFO_26237 [Tritrichomonas foetus]|eukprot:OHT05881.1 hypothetical protein TRFO_26237 [Tritrichomonas foetus]